MDLGSPKLSDFEAARPTLLVALAGSCREESRRRSRDAGFDRHLSQPVEIESLYPMLSGSGAIERGRGRGTKPFIL